MRLIDADKLEEYKVDCCVSLTEWQEGWNDAIDTVMGETPTVDTEPVRYGKWIMKSDPYGFFDEIPVCSECGCTTKMREKTKFCPNCGAKMDEEKENEG